MIYFSDFGTAGGGDIGWKSFTHQTTSAQVVSLTDLVAVGGGTFTLQTGDVIFVAYAQVTAGSPRAEAAMLPSGYTKFHNVLFFNDTVDCNLLTSYKVMSGTPDTDITLGANTSTNNDATAIIIALRGVDTTTVPDVVATTATAGNGGQPDPPANTPSSAGAFPIVAGACAYTTLSAFTDPGDFQHFFTFASSAASNKTAVGVGIKTNWTSGAFDPAQWGGGTTNTGASNCSAHCVLRML